MNENIERLLRGTLRGPGNDKRLYNASFQNSLWVPIALYAVDHEGKQRPVPFGDGNPKHYMLLPGEGAYCYALNPGWWYFFRNAITGAFVTLLQNNDTNAEVPSVNVMGDLLQRPDNIGSIPVPTAAALIPPDTPRVLVGTGLINDDLWVAREQFWQRSTDSFVLAPNSERTVSTTSFSGLQNTSSDQETISKAISGSASLSMWSISASLSASLSATSASFQQVAVNTETTQYESLHLSNPDTKPRMLLKWQLMNVITVFKPPELGASPAATIALATLVSAAAPAIIESFDLSKIEHPTPTARCVIPAR